MYVGRKFFDIKDNSFNLYFPFSEISCHIPYKLNIIKYLNRKIIKEYRTMRKQ